MINITYLKAHLLYLLVENISNGKVSLIEWLWYILILSTPSAKKTSLEDNDHFPLMTLLYFGVGGVIMNGHFIFTTEGRVFIKRRIKNFITYQRNRCSRGFLFRFLYLYLYLYLTFQIKKVRRRTSTD